MRYLLLVLPLAAAPLRAQPPLRDPALPYGSWGEAAREAAAAIGDRPLVRPAGGAYTVDDAVILDDDGRRYRAHVVAIEAGRYVVHYDGFGPDWTRRVDVDQLSGYQPGYLPSRRADVAPRTPQVGDELQAQANGRWSDARVIALRGTELRVHWDGQPRSADAWVAADRVRPFAGGPARTTRLAPGKYGCTASRYDAGQGRYVFDPKGSVVLGADGGYQYLGFAQPSVGRWALDSTEAATFRGGHLDGGEATPIVQRPGRFYLTAPRIGERWTCGAGAR